MTTRSPDDTVTEIEFTLDMPRLVLAAALVLLILAAAYALGRATAPASDADQRAPLERASPVEDSAGRGVFDTASDAAGARAGWELELGTLADRSAAEARRSLARALGVEAVVVRTAQGGYRVAAGPYASEAEARAAAVALAKLPGGSVRIVARSP